QIFISPSNGGPAAKLGTDGGFGPEWSPDGQWIAFNYAAPTWGGLVKARVGGDGSLVRLSEHGCGPVAPAWSPDGAWIACGRAPSTSGSRRIIATSRTRTSPVTPTSCATTSRRIGGS